MSIPCAVLMCHAPIVIPAIGRTRAGQCARTTEAMRRVAERLVAHAPDVLVIVSPHAPRDPRRWGISSSEALAGDFGNFGVPEVGLELPGASAAAIAVEQAARQQDLGTWKLPGSDLDHGTLVPLHFVCEAGWRGPTLLVALPHPGTATEATMGRAIAAAAAQRGERWAILASGDMSHRLLPDAPAGFHPRARDFDSTFRDLVAAGDLRRACDVDVGLRDLAAEDVVDSCTVAAGAVDFDATGHEFVAYEGPFGVGYLEAVLHETARPARAVDVGRGGRSATPAQELTRIARDAIAAHLAGRTYRPPTLDGPWRASRGVFVTLRTRDGQLRGCVGHIEPALTTLSDEIASVAIASATHDTRFVPVRPDELAGLTIELSLLTPPEPVRDAAALDPHRYGVVVSHADRRGVLLPAIEGIDTVEQQVRIAASKGGIDLQGAFALQRFEVVKLCEPGGASHDLH